VSKLKFISKNIKYNAVSQVLTFLINFALLPFMVFHVGKEVYGVYILVVTFTGYMGLMDFGVGGTTIKYVAEFAPKGDNKKVNDIISASFSFFMIIGILAAALLFMLSFCFDRIFKIDVYNMTIARHLFLIAAASSLFIWPGRTFDYALQGFQRYDRFAVNNIIFTVLTGISAYFIFTNNMGIVCFLAVSSIFSILKCISAYLIVNKSILKEHIKFPYFHKETFKMIFDFSFYLFLSSLATILIFNVDNIIVGAFVTVAAVTLYNAGLNLQQGFRMINALIEGPLFPAYVEMESKGELERQRAILFKGTKYKAFVFIPFVLITIIFAKPFIKCWMGDIFLAGVVPAQILIAFWLFNSILDIGAGMLTAKGYVKTIFKIVFINAVANLGLSLILVRYFGIIGVALGTTIPMVFISFPLFIWQILKTFKITFAEYFNSSIKDSLVVFAVAGVLAFIIRRALPVDRLWLVVFEMGAAYVITMFAAYTWLLSENEQSEIRSMIKF